MSMNFTITLADRYAAAKFAADAANEALEALKAEIKELGQERHVGVTCDITLSICEQMRFSQKLAAQFMTAEQIEACKAPVLMETIRIKAKGV